MSLRSVLPYVPMIFVGVPIGFALADSFGAPGTLGFMPRFHPLSHASPLIAAVLIGAAVIATVLPWTPILCRKSLTAAGTILQSVIAGLCLGIGPVTILYVLVFTT